MTFCASFLTAAGCGAPSPHAFKIYYGDATPAAVAALQHYPLVIIEPGGWPAKQVQQLRAAGVQVFGYVNVLEMAPEYRLPPSAQLRLKGRPVAVPQWGTTLMDLRQPAVQAALAAKIQRIAAHRYTGVMLDTVGDIDDYLTGHPRVQTDLRRTLADWLQHQQRRHPKLAWLQNWGFLTYQQATRGLVDGVLWEDFAAPKIAADAWSQRWLDYFDRTQTPLYVVCPDIASLYYAQELGLHHARNADDHYDQLTKE